MKKFDMLKSLAYLYILLPLIIFLLGWTKLYIIGLPLSVAIVLCLYTMIKNTQKPENFKNQSKTKIYKIIIIALIIILWVLWSGIGGYAWQNSDHYWRNELFELLVKYKWPVVKGTVEGTRAIAYYIGFWMVPALVGKLFGISAGYFAQYVWALIGVSLVYKLMCRRFKKVSILILLAFIFFSGLDIIGQLVNSFQDFTDGEIGYHLENWIYGYQFSSFTTQLFWVFNQAIYAWIITLIMIEEKNRAMVLIMAAGLLSSTLPMVGLAPIVLVKVYSNVIEKSKSSGEGFFKSFSKTCLTYENIVGFISALVIMMLFFGNEAVANSSVINQRTAGNTVFTYLLFLSIEIVPFILFTFKRNYKEKLYQASLVMLLICPLLTIGDSIDFCMRASIPALLILFIYIVETFDARMKLKDKKSIIAFCLVFAIGAITPISEFVRTTVHQKEHMEVGKVMVGSHHIFEELNFSTNVETNLFFKYLAK